MNNWATTGWNIIYPTIAEKRDTMEAKFFEEQADVDAKALELYNAGDVDGAKAYLTEYVCNTMNDVYDEWWAFAWELVGKYNDGQIYNAEEKSTSGFPYSKEYLDAVDYGRDMLALYEAIPGNEPAEEAPAEEPTEEVTEPETPEEDSETPAEETPADTEKTEPAVNTTTNNNTALIIGIVAAVAIVIVAVVVLNKKKKN